jgi:hypothetical protein
VLGLRKRRILLLLAALVVLLLVLYPSTQCRVTEADLQVSPLKAFVIPVQQGYAIGFFFNVTNRADCEIGVQSVRVMLRALVYPDGRQVTQDRQETETVSRSILPGQTSSFSYTFDSYFDYRPSRLMLRLEMTFTGSGPIVVFDGELPISG